jgi:hypothetical protein
VTLDEDLPAGVALQERCILLGGRFVGGTEVVLVVVEVGVADVLPEQIFVGRGWRCGGPGWRRGYGDSRDGLHGQTTGSGGGEGVVGRTSGSDGARAVWRNGSEAGDAYLGRVRRGPGES